MPRSWRDQLEDLTKRQDAFLRAAERLDPALQEQKAVFGSWSIKELVAHVSGWEIEVERQFQLFVDGLDTAIEHDVDAFNDRSVRERADLSWAEAIAELREVQERFRRTAASVGPELAACNAEFEDWIDVQIEHYEHHTAQLLGGDRKARSTEARTMRGEKVSKRTTLPMLRTSRLQLRQVTSADVDALLRLFGDPELTRFWGHSTLGSREDAEALLAEIEAGAADGTLLQWGVERADEEGLIGTCTLAHLDRQHRRAELGILLGPDAQGKGYAGEAATAVIDHGFERLNLHRITADVDPRNEQAVRLLDRLGFRKEGRLREHHRQHGEWQDGLIFGLLEDDWDRR